MKKRILCVNALLALTLTGCAAPLLLAGGGIAAGTLSLREKGISGTMGDSSINTVIAAKLHQTSPEAFTQIDVDVYMGEVLLTGSVKDPSWSLEAEKLSWKSSGVRAVYNHIQTTEDSSFLDYTKDTWITTKIKSKMLAEKKINSLNYMIKTVGGTAYVMGTAESEEEMNAVHSILKDTSGLKEVMTYVTTKK